jgi:hypothetical protein
MIGEEMLVEEIMTTFFSLIVRPCGELEVQCSSFDML